MKRLAACLLLAALLGPALAQNPAPTGGAADTSELKLKALHQGYAFDQPEILVRQRLFGLAHGVSLLAAACLDLPAQSGATQEAYAAWHLKQAQTIDGLALELSQYYFGSRAVDARWPDLVRALGLKERIEDALGTVELEEACSSLPTAIIRPRYELDRLLVEINAADAATGGDVDVQPAPAADVPPADAETRQTRAPGLR